MIERKMYKKRMQKEGVVNVGFRQMRVEHKKL